MTPIPDTISTFERIIQLQSLRGRTREEYVRPGVRLARFCGMAGASQPRCADRTRRAQIPLTRTAPLPTVRSREGERVLPASVRDGRF